jgi:hypothetical protein
MKRVMRADYGLGRAGHACGTACYAWPFEHAEDRQDGRQRRGALAANANV